MKSKILVRIIAVVALATGTSAWAQSSASDRLPEKLSGLINAYTPQTSPTKPPVGPYEIRGTWTMRLKRDGTKADFSAVMNMILSDGWVVTSSAAPAIPPNPPNPPNFDPSIRNAHTHHITMTDADVTRLPNGGFQIVGPAFVTLNGGATPFAQQSPGTTVVITGGTDVEFSNFTLTFGMPANGHFGILPLPGVVRKVSR